MNKKEELEVVDSIKVGIHLMNKMEGVTIFYKIKENLNGRVMKKEILSGKGVVLIKEVLVLTKEEAILILEVVLIVIVSNVVKKGIDPLNVDPLKMGKIIDMLCLKETLRVQ